MKIFTKPAVLALAVFVFQACTKDRVPSPDNFNNNTSIPQSVIYSQNFDSSLTNLPTGWSAPTSGGWAIDTSNASTGYTGASGLSNVSVSNQTTTGGTYNLDSRIFSTVGDTIISITYSARRTKHFSDNGSSVILYWSIDGGATWNAVNYTEVTGDSNWYIVNGGSRIFLPATASGQTNLKFRWVANTVATASGTYRIDDFKLYAGVK